MKRAFAAFAVAMAWLIPGTAQAHGGLQFLGQAIVPTGTMFRATTVGGLSSIAYDAHRGVYYSISDDPSLLQPARYYTIGLDVRDGRLTNDDVHFLDVTTLLAPDGKPYPANSLDPEGLGLTRDRQLIITSEGFTNSLIDPFIRRYALDGTFLRSLPVPAPFLTTADHSSGVRPNLGFETASVAPDGRYMFTATENALYQDGPAATINNGSRSRLLRYDLRTNRLDRQWEYDTDPVAEPPVPADQFSVNGVAELLPLNNEFLISMERSFSVGAPGTGNKIKLYSVALPGATNFNGEFRIPDRVRPARKQLLLDLDTLHIPLDNVEGMTFGPRLRDGRQTLVLVSDNNFAPSQFTQFLLFAFHR
jgi:3-phytase/alkaline phosphatase D